jgi:predicted carbohydrate-binding protein with CBM5 and CBM33 domain
MGQVQALRSAHGIVSIPVGKAIYCQHCENITNSPGDHCGECGSDFVLHLATLINQPPGGPDSGPASAARIVPAFHLELARAA